MKKKILNGYFWLLGKVASLYIKKHKVEVIWVTWSVWKTSVRMIVYQILAQFLNDKVVYTSDKNYNWELWLSFSIFRVKDYSPTILWLLKQLFVAIYKLLFEKRQYDIIVLEYWIDHIWEMDFLLSIVKPNISIFTKIDMVHSSQFVNPDVTAKEKFKLVQNTKQHVFLNYDDSYARSGYSKVSIKKYMYTTNQWLNDNIDICYEDYILQDWDNDITASFDLYNQWKKLWKITTNICWKENLWYIWVWFKILDIYFQKFYNKTYFQKDQLINVTVDFILQPWRFTMLKWVKWSVLFDSTYNAAPESMKKVIENVFYIRNNLFANHKLIFVLWDMRELWDFAESEHRQLAWIIWQSVDIVILVWENMKKYTYDELIKSWFSQKYIYYLDNSKKAWLKLKSLLESSDQKYIILFKWSQNTIFLEESIKYVLANKEDEKRLTRQDKLWLEKK